MVTDGRHGLVWPFLRCWELVLSWPRIQCHVDFRADCDGCLRAYKPSRVRHSGSAPCFVAMCHPSCGHEDTHIECPTAADLVSSGSASSSCDLGSLPFYSMTTKLSTRLTQIKALEISFSWWRKKESWNKTIFSCYADYKWHKLQMK